MNRRLLALLGGLLVLSLLAGAGGYLAGESTGADVQAARTRGEELGLRDARESAARRGYEHGLEAGKKEGYRATYKLSYRTAHRVKTRKLERAAAREAAAAQAASREVNPYAGLEYTDELPSGEPGYVLPEEQRTLACVGFDAATGRCVGD
jgi:hypothetical protein